MSARADRKALLAATTPATSATATTAFKAYGNSVSLFITTVTGGAGTCTLTLQVTDDGTNYATVYDLDSAVSWTINVNSAGRYYIDIPFSFIPNTKYRFLYSCTTAAGTIAIDAVLWENPAGNFSANIGDVHADIGAIQVSTDTLDNCVVVDDAAFTPETTSVMMAGAEFDDTTPGSVNEGDAGALRMSANRSLYTTLRDAAGNERGANIDASNQLAVADSTVGTNTTDLPNVIGTDGSAGPTKCLSVGGTEAGGNIQEVLVDSDGHLQIDVLSSASPTITDVVYPATGSAAIAHTTGTLTQAFKLDHISLHLSAAGTTTENFTVNLDAADGAEYDTNLFTLNLATDSIVDLVLTPEDDGLQKLYEAGDAITIAWPNTETRTYGVRIVGELV